MKFDKYSLTAVATAAATAVLNIVSYFFLPEKIITQIGFSGAGNRLSSVGYLLISAFIVFLSAGMIVFSDKYQPEKKTKWFAANLIITVLNSVIIFYNLAVK